MSYIRVEKIPQGPLTEEVSKTFITDLLYSYLLSLSFCSRKTKHYISTTPRDLMILLQQNYSWGKYLKLMKQNPASECVHVHVT